MAHPDGKPRTLTVPLFPLPNVVLFPRAVLPLHVFEQRYREMTTDALKGDRLIAMALLRPGWEQNYYSRPAIEPVVCVGQILTHEKLADGKYNFLLQGGPSWACATKSGIIPIAWPRSNCCKTIRSWRLIYPTSAFG